MFTTHLCYTDRESRQRFVADKFKDIFQTSVLDVGADEGYIQKFLPAGAVYKGIGLGGNNPDIVAVNLEEKGIPFADASFETVMCLDVLEHLENIHAVFGELCRVSSKHVLISLPNPLADILSSIRSRNYKPGQLAKFYGLPPEREADRHKWFFTATEAQNFVSYQAEKHGFEVLFFEQGSAKPKAYSLRGLLWQLRQKLFAMLCRNPEISTADLTPGTLWWVLRRKQS